MNARKLMFWGSEQILHSVTQRNSTDGQRSWLKLGRDAQTVVEKLWRGLNLRCWQRYACVISRRQSDGHNTWQTEVNLPAPTLQTSDHAVPEIHTFKSDSIGKRGPECSGLQIPLPHFWSWGVGGMMLAQQKRHLLQKDKWMWTWWLLIIWDMRGGEIYGVGLGTRLFLYVSSQRLVPTPTEHSSSITQRGRTQASPKCTSAF